MKTWAEINIDNKVINTLIASDSFIINIPGTFIECTESTGLGSIGMTYNKEKNKFIHAQPYPSWVLDEESLEWVSPIGSKPSDGFTYNWDEENQSWIKIASINIDL